ncbi:cytochrome c [Nitrosomonas sp. Is35]|uniref:c-type cytochrome n=1 Tax=unclassified Nitrosomonas TaxID=2609265 RepID=UPI000A09FCCB|nr:MULTISPECIES: cytochrome c [unclassified Nitrosomonas]MBX9916683.1 cytochrome c [Nitrosomonas sp.]MDV6340219.1 cytochrome c [Nitrosomonas sp. Is24]MDV6345963.1 cytochrome c [Nitrosomonas sp. Is35]OQW81911.1 MAG: cytochrome C [Proteobacteria bacterium ST_bin16]
MKQKSIMNLLLALGMFLAFSGATQAAGDAAAAKDKLSMCEGCHGIPGYKTAFPSAYHVPKLGGQHAEYIIKALEGYKSGSRSHPTMTALAKTLSQQDIEDLAAYYSKN